MNGLRVLVAEDDAVIAMLFAEVLTGMGYDVCAIESTEADLVVAAARCRPDVMIVDVRLRNGSGVSAVEKILRSGHVPHVFVSGDISSIRTLGTCAVVIEKPFRESELAEAIQHALAAAAPS